MAAANQVVAGADLRAETQSLKRCFPSSVKRLEDLRSCRLPQTRRNFTQLKRRGTGGLIARPRSPRLLQPPLAW